MVHEYDTAAYLAGRFPHRGPIADYTLPSPSLGPPLLSVSWSPPLFCGIPLELSLPEVPLGLAAPAEPDEPAGVEERLELDELSEPDALPEAEEPPEEDEPFWAGAGAEALVTLLELFELDEPPHPPPASAASSPTLSTLASRVRVSNMLIASLCATVTRGMSVRLLLRHGAPLCALGAEGVAVAQTDADAVETFPLAMPSAKVAPCTSSSDSSDQLLPASERASHNLRASY